MRNIATDVLSADAVLDGYKLVIAPALLILDEMRASRLKTFVADGGHLVLTIRSGMKDDFNALLPNRQPGMLADVAGIEVEDYYALQDAVPVLGENWSGESHRWAERLKVRDETGTNILARYGESNGWLDGQAAITSHPYEKGLVTYVGVYLDETSQQKLIDGVVQEAGVEPVMNCPAGVEARKRVNTQGDEVFILINHERRSKQLHLPWLAHECIKSLNIQELELEPYGVAVLTRIEKDGSK
jgi:beta-galactosidase